MTARLLIIGGGANQLHLVDKAKSRGYWVAVSDVNQDPPCKAKADTFFQIDTTDAVASLRAAKQSRITAVVTDQSDVAVPTAAYIADQMGLPGIGFETALRFTNKHLMRQALAVSRADLIPESHLYENEHDLMKHLESPICQHEMYIVKPLNSQGSKGIARLNPQNYHLASLQAFRESRGQGVLLEEFIEGDEFSVEAFVVDGTVHNLAVTRKFHYPQNDCIDYRNTYLGDIPIGLEAELFAVNETVISILGLKTGSTHGEYKVSKKGIKLMEIAARGGGGNISGIIVPFLTEFSPTDALLDFATGAKPAVEVRNYRDKFAVLRFFDFPPGKVKRIKNAASHIDGLLYFDLRLVEGDTIRSVGSSRDRPGYFVVGTDDRDRTLAAEKAVLGAVSVEYDEAS